MLLYKISKEYIMNTKTNWNLVKNTHTNYENPCYLLVWGILNVKLSLFLKNKPSNYLFNKHNSMQDVYLFISYWTNEGGINYIKV